MKIDRLELRPFRVFPILLVALAGIVAAGCATAPLPPAAPVITYEQKIAWILRLEDERLL
jgi:hypothetical protein